MLTPNPVQSSYSQYLTVGQVGDWASALERKADTKICQDLASPHVGIGFGRAVSQGTASDRAAVLGAPSGHAFVGITLSDQTLANIDTTFTDKYQNGDNMGVAVAGDVWVLAEGNVGAGEAVYFNATTGALGHSGGTLIDNARWMTSASAGHLAVVRLGATSGNASGN